ncbi:hypothetical protein BEL04_00175 [Mucilaginibacter sp. PPCGB 2223]|nr:hypothetical protein BEL04_00175 [Mucilaginibacter sp. PPCGB 2223]
MFLALLCCCQTICLGQILKPVKWSYASKKLDEHHAVIYFKADIDDGWHIYSLNQPDGGPKKTTFVLNRNTGFTANGKPIEPKPKKHFEKAFGIYVYYFEHSVIFQQKILIKKPQTTIKGTLTFMVCNNHQCLSPEDIEFAIPIN